MYFIIIVMFGRKLCSKCSFIAIFVILANFAAFLDHTKGNADVNKMMANVTLTFIFS